jgi:uncharacterized protein with NRDE domain
MCTALVYSQVDSRYPVIVAANRDEMYARGTEGPQVLSHAPRIVGGRDVARGGTWLGLGAAGTFALITNQRTYGRTDPARASRGQVVLGALRAGPPPAMRAFLERLDATAYNPFNLLYGDAAGLFVAYARADQPRVAIEPVPAGMTVLPNDALDAPDWPKVARARALAGDLGGGTWSQLSRRLHAALSDHALPPLEAIATPPSGTGWSRALARQLQALCIHTPAYGTRSATIVALAPGRVAHYLHAPGPPCRTALEDVTGLLR